jgi:hypothetical protein
MSKWVPTRQGGIQRHTSIPLQQPFNRRRTPSSECATDSTERLHH